jgi:hypothetical protein
VENHAAVGGAAHARVRDAHHVGDALLENLGRQRHVAHFGHAGVALRPAVLEHHDRALVHLQVRVVDALVEVLDVLEYHRAAAVAHELRARRRGLDDRAVGAQVAAQHRDTGVLFEGFVERRNHVTVPAGGVFDVLPLGFAVYDQGVTVK